MTGKAKIFMSAFMALAVSVGSTVCYADGYSYKNELSGNQVNLELAVNDVSAGAILSCVAPADLNIDGYAVAVDALLEGSKSYAIRLSSGGTTSISAGAKVDDMKNEKIIGAQCTFTVWYDTAAWSKVVSVKNSKQDVKN